MIKLAREFRLIPILLLATISLFVLKVTGIVFDGGYTLGDKLRERGSPPGIKVTSASSVPDYPRIVVAGQPEPPQTTGSIDASKNSANSPWAKEMFNFGSADKSREPEVTGSVGTDKLASLPQIKGTASGKPQNDNDIVTGSAGGGAPAAPPGQAAVEPLKSTDKPPAPTKVDVGSGDAQSLTPGRINSPGERAILNRLQDRRESLENRDKELDMRESLIKAAEKRLEAKVGELKEVEGRIKTATDSRDKEEKERLKGLVQMYENMKPKDAARIFDRLDIRVLVDISTSMKPITMSAVLAQMTPEAAERLTVELATRANGAKPAGGADDLPKIGSAPGR